MENNEVTKKENGLWVFVKTIAYIAFAFAIMFSLLWLVGAGEKGGRMGCYEENGELICQDPRGN